MSLTTQIPSLYLLESENRGRGVYTSEKIEKDSLIEICPVIILSKKDTEQIHETLLHDFYFIWDIEAKTSAIALGYGSLYNHSEAPNAEFEIDLNAKVIRFIATIDILPNEEITTDYIGLKDTGNSLWFKPIT